MSLPATAPWTPTLLPAQVKEELSGWLLNRERADFSKGNYITHRNKCKAKAALNIFSINRMFSMTQDRYLLRCAAEARLLFVRLVFGRMFVRAFCHVLRLLHQLWWIHGLHGDYVEGVQILQRTDRNRLTAQDVMVLLYGRGFQTKSRIYVKALADICLFW